MTGYIELFCIVTHHAKIYFIVFITANIQSKIGWYCTIFFLSCVNPQKILQQAYIIARLQKVNVQII